jgi:hypothetical protein
MVHFSIEISTSISYWTSLHFHAVSLFILSAFLSHASNPWPMFHFCRQIQDVEIYDTILNAQNKILQMIPPPNSKHIHTENFGDSISKVRRDLEKLVVTQLVKKLPAFYGTRRFTTVFTRDRHWLQSSPYPHFLFL